MFTCGHYDNTISTCLFQSSPPHKAQSCQHQEGSQSISTRLVCRSTPDLELLLLCKCLYWYYCVANDSRGIVVMLQLPINSPRGWHRSSHSLTSASLIKGYFSDITKSKNIGTLNQGMCSRLSARTARLSQGVTKNASLTKNIMLRST